ASAPRRTSGQPAPQGRVGGRPRRLFGRSSSATAPPATPRWAGRVRGPLPSTLRWDLGGDAGADAPWGDRSKGWHHAAGDRPGSRVQV
ncbi:MAG: hypothetical protein AVDCRST_MAG48-278, partial [uncultured Friedmanniella sp.]